MKRIAITAPNFSAGLTIENERCVAAPPVMRWTVGKPVAEILRYCRRQGWTIEEKA